jgi:rhodanese-related sulfurtransferase
MQELTLFISQHALLSLAIAIVFVLLLLVELVRGKRNSTQLTPLQVTQKINHERAAIIDIRPKDVFQNGHIIDAQLITPQEIKDHSKKLEKFKTQPLILICNTGIESQKMATQLLKQGYNVMSLAGGMNAWRSAQMPVIKESSK